MRTFSISPFPLPFLPFPPHLTLYFSLVNFGGFFCWFCEGTFLMCVFLYWVFFGEEFSQSC